MLPGPTTATRSPADTRVSSTTACTAQARGSLRAAALKPTFSGSSRMQRSGTTHWGANEPSCQYPIDSRRRQRLIAPLRQ